MAGFVSCAVFNVPNRFTMEPLFFAIVLLINDQEPMIKWSRQPAAVSKILLKESLASATSKKTEIKLTGVARASLGELLLDYEDFLRQKRMRQWHKNDPEALIVRNKFKEKSDKSGRSDWPDKSDLYRFSELPAEQLANTLICLINQASYLLWQQMQTLERQFLECGGFTERMYNTRKNIRKY